MDRTTLRQLLRFEQWANAQTLASLGHAGSPPAEALRRLAHIAAAQQLWLDRVKGGPASLPVWPGLALENLEPLLEELADEWRKVVENDDLDREVSYTNSKGEPWRSAVGDIVTHLVIHGEHHRGQIAADLRRAGAEPAYTDYIQAARSGALG